MWSIIVTELRFYALPAFNSPAESWQGCIQLWSAFTSPCKHKMKSLSLWKGESAWPGSTCWEHQNVAEAWHVSKEWMLSENKQLALSVQPHLQNCRFCKSLWIILPGKTVDWHTDQPAYIEFCRGHGHGHHHDHHHTDIHHHSSIFFLIHCFRKPFLLVSGYPASITLKCFCRDPSHLIQDWLT